jgi:ferredoxin
LSTVEAVGLRVEIDKDCCISSGRCVGDEPTAFGFDEDELAEALPGVDALDQRRLVDVARNCPGQAIAVFADDVEIRIE